MKSINEVHQKSIEIQEQVLSKQKERMQKQHERSMNYLHRSPRKKQTLVSLVINLVLLAFCLLILLTTSNTWIWNLLIIDLISIAVNIVVYMKYAK